ncbi:unnamed protein product [Dovyalis caffra]|uniref:Uncharacterized protein n=1 Tax=Dovyalis caffra TaxID=77055 RepID=A0AAV1RFF0_9ROSI|nr:unnamed protein product [Dovyalis caffra]
MSTFDIFNLDCAEMIPNINWDLPPIYDVCSDDSFSDVDIDGTENMVKDTDEGDISAGIFYCTEDDKELSTAAIDVHPTIYGRDTCVVEIVRKLILAGHDVFMVVEQLSEDRNSILYLGPD